MDKASLRALVRRKRSELSPAELLRRSEALAQIFLQSDVYRRASTLYAYLSISGEVSTAPILRQAWLDGKTVAVPRVTEGELRFIRLEEDTPIAPGYRGIPEPVGGEEIREPNALVLTPGVAFTPGGGRMGYGGGFYDRFFASEPGHPRVALCFDFQIFPSLPTEPHDITVDQVIWDN